MSATLKLARLLEVLRSGEVLAAQVASQQSQLAPVAWMSRALRSQATQERSHATMAAMALALVGSKVLVPDVTAALHKRITHDLDSGNLAASMLGLQGVVEHLGEALLESLGGYAHPAGALLHALRVKVLAQERGHVLLGQRCLQALSAETRAADTLCIRDEYRAIGRTTAIQVATLLDDARLDASAFWVKVDCRLCDWHTRADATLP